MNRRSFMRALVALSAGAVVPLALAKPGLLQLEREDLTPVGYEGYGGIFLGLPIVVVATFARAVDCTLFQHAWKLDPKLLRVAADDGKINISLAGKLSLEAKEDIDLLAVHSITGPIPLRHKGVPDIRVRAADTIHFLWDKNFLSFSG